MDRKDKLDVEEGQERVTDAKHAPKPYFCDRCKVELPVAEQREHEDWHFAVDLSTNEGSNAAPVNAAPPASNQPSAYQQTSYQQPAYQQMPYSPNASIPPPHHTNRVIEAGMVRARDEQEMQTALQLLQLQYKIYNSEIEPEHDTDYPCGCPIHQYKRRKWQRSGVQDMWSQAVMYKGEKAYNDNFLYSGSIFSSNPYRYQVMSPYQGFQLTWGMPSPQPSAHNRFIHGTIALNNSLNQKAQAKVDADEPSFNIWDSGALDAQMSQLTIGTGDQKPGSSTSQPKSGKEQLKNGQSEKRDSKRLSVIANKVGSSGESSKTSKLSSFKKSLGIKSTEEKAIHKVEKMSRKAEALRNDILAEELGRWPDQQWRSIVANYQEKVGMARKIEYFRTNRPIQYLHLLRAGYFEPIPVAWANQNSNPLKFSIEAAVGWRGITPAWRGYEDTAEERLYWVINHREGSTGMRMKPDFISAMEMARARMATAVEPPPQYFSTNDTCHLQHTSEGYSKQVMPPPFRSSGQPEVPTDDTMILLDVSGSMGFDPIRPVYNQYLITGYTRSTQPKNKDVARAIIRRFTDAMSNHDHSFNGYDLVTFANHASYIGKVDHRNFDSLWRSINIGGGTRVMTGWQQVKELHFRKHSESATHHPIYGWQAGPQTPILRLLLLLDGEATDMDEFELDLLGLSWAHVTIFLIGVDGCPHHHRHANELQRISDNNHNVSFVDAQGNMPERFVTHELLKRHLGYDVSMREFEEMEELPAYSET